MTMRQEKQARRCVSLSQPGYVQTETLTLFDSPESCLLDKLNWRKHDRETILFDTAAEWHARSTRA